MTGASDGVIRTEFSREIKGEVVGLWWEKETQPFMEMSICETAGFTLEQFYSLHEWERRAWIYYYIVKSKKAQKQNERAQKLAKQHRPKVR